MNNKSNRLVNYLAAWILVTIIGIILFLLPSVYNVQPANTSITLFVIGVLMAGLGFGMTINYSVRILKQKFNLPQSTPIAEWVLIDEEWKQFCFNKLKNQIKSNLRIFYLVIVACVILDVIFIFILNELIVVFDFLLSEMVLISIPVFISPLFNYLMDIKSNREVKIYDYAVKLNGELYNWGIRQGKLIDIELISENPPFINIEYSIPYRRMSPMFTNMKNYFVRVPVPSYELSMATEIVNEFQKKINNTISV